VDITIRDSIDDLFEESGHGAWQSSLRLASGEVDITIDDSIEKRTLCLAILLRRERCV
jgi:hypothetical protein